MKAFKLIGFLTLLLATHQAYAGQIVYAEEMEFPFGYNWEVNTQHQDNRTPASTSSSGKKSDLNQQDSEWLEVQKVTVTPSSLDNKIEDMHVLENKAQ